MSDSLEKSLAAWLNGNNPWATSRSRLAATYPVLAVALSLGSTNPSMMSIAAAVDRGEDPAYALPAVLGISEAAGRGLVALDAETVGEAWCHSPLELLRAMGIVDPGTQPRTGSDWAVFRDYWIGTGLAQHEGPVLEHLFRGLCGLGYGPHGQMLGQQLVLGGSNTDDYVPMFPDFVIFVREYLDAAFEGPMFERPWGDSPAAIRLPVAGPDRCEHFLMRYTADGLVLQWNRWNQLNGFTAMGDAYIAEIAEARQADCARILRAILPDLESAMRWIRCYPV